MPKRSIVIATIKPWNISNFRSWIVPRGFKKYLIVSPKKLTLEYLRKLNPRYVFFPHWSWMIPKEIYDNFECVVFHSANLPFGRGGSPIQNHIVRGIYNIKVCALKVVADVDAGPVYMHEPINIKTGSAEEILKKISVISFKMMKKIIRLQPVPKSQCGKVVIWKRRRPEESSIPDLLSGRKLYDFIRMLDADGYPPAFIEWKGWRYEFRDAILNSKGEVVARVSISKIKTLRRFLRH
ncbi:MAG: methionyl-tRNA formyltransferase [bacterium]|nr:methionyl-tRNA formyltransferase [bacterium]